MMMAAAVMAVIRPPKGNDTGFIYPEMSRGREFPVAELFHAFHLSSDPVPVPVPLAPQARSFLRLNFATCWAYC